MATWKVQDDAGRHWFIDAPADVTEAEVNDFAAEHADSWVSGARYRMEVEGEPAPAEKPAKSARNIEAEAAVASLDEQIAELEENIQSSKALRGRTFGDTPGGAATGVVPAGGDIRADIQSKLAALKAQRAKLVVGDTGQTVGGIGGALAGAGAGMAAGTLVAGPPGMVVGGLVGSILGGAAGTAAGTHLWDIPAAREAIDVSDEEAAALIQSRAIESLVVDGVFTLILGPGGRVIGKMRNGQKWLPALKASAKESFAWDQIANSEKAQLDKVVQKRAAAAPKGLATEASDALGVVKSGSDQEASEALVRDIARRSGGHVPTQGEMTGLVQGGERFARSQSPMPFFKNDKRLAETAESIRKTALADLDAAGAYASDDLGLAMDRVVDSAERTLKRVAGPVFERAAQQNVYVDMRSVLNYVEDVLKRDTDSAKRLLTGSGDRESLQATLKVLKKNPMMSPRAAQDFISGNKSVIRKLADEKDFMGKALLEMNSRADAAYLSTLRDVDPALAKDLLGVRNMYRETLGDIASETMEKLALKDPEFVGRALTPKGAVTKLRLFRAALNRSVYGAPGKPRMKYGKVSELSQEQLKQERARIDAGLIKGFIEKNTQSLSDLGPKLRDPEFRATLKELLVGNGAADPRLGAKVLDELDRVMGVMKLIKPEMAPQPGRIGVPGVGGIGAGTVGAAATGDIRTAAPLVFLSLGTTRLIGSVVSKAMTTGNMGALRTFQRAASLVPAAGKNAAAAEALMGALRELDAWDRDNGGLGLPELGGAQ